MVSVTAVTYHMFDFLRQSLTREHATTGAALLTIRVLEPSGIFPPGQLELLLATKPPHPGAQAAAPVEWVSEGAWAWVQALSSVPALSHVAREIESASDRWNHWVHHPTPEAVDPPGPAARGSPLEKV
ncbi:hypothetical protein T484DRAFT_1800097 [Baffinella frigidus]|nr:hypothetical protein T484DRAFT_1800097 [Cryptophyta sp. CCMP2293]